MVCVFLFLFGLLALLLYVEVISEGGSDRDNGRDADDVDEDDDDDLTSLLQRSKSVPISELFIVPG